MFYGVFRKFRIGRSNRVIDDVFIDINCPMKIKSKFGKFYAFNSEVDFEHTASSEEVMMNKLVMSTMSNINLIFLTTIDEVICILYK